MIYGSDQFFVDEQGKRWQRCLCTARQPGNPFVSLVTVFADEGNAYMVEPFAEFESRITGRGKELSVLMHPKGTVVILKETSLPRV